MKPATLEEIWEATTTAYNKQYVITDETTHKGAVDLIIIAMRIACNQAINMCAIKQAEAYKEMGYTNTGKKIEQMILQVKDEIG